MWTHTDRAVRRAARAARRCSRACRCCPPRVGAPAAPRVCARRDARAAAQLAIADDRDELRTEAMLYACSHLGDAKFAASVVVFGRRLPCGGVACDWYGYMSLDDVPDLMDALRRGVVLERLWRGTAPVDGGDSAAAGGEGCGGGH